MHSPVLLLLLLVLFPLTRVSGDYYSDLSLGEDATESDIKKAFRQLSRQLHPDHNPSAEAREEYAKVQQAYGVLSDRKKRKVYDMMGEDGLKELETGKGRRHQHMDPFGGLFGGGGEVSSRGEDVHLSLKVSLPDIYNGATHTLNFKKNKLRSKEVVKACMTCKAKPPQMRRVQVAPGFVVQQQMPPACDHVCTDGPKQVMRGYNQLLEVFIEQGVPEGYEIRFDMEGDEAPDRLPGDLLFKVKSAPHPVFTRVKDDLKMEMEISLLEALVGFRKTIRHLDDREVTVQREGVTPPGFQMALWGEGMPRHNVPSEKGILHVNFRVQFPTALTTEQASAARQLFA